MTVNVQPPSFFLYCVHSICHFTFWMFSVFENYRYYLLRIAQLNLDDYEIFHSQMRALSEVWSDSVASKKKKQCSQTGWDQIKSLIYMKILNSYIKSYDFLLSY